MTRRLLLLRAAAEDVDAPLPPGLLLLALVLELFAVVARFLFPLLPVVAEGGKATTLSIVRNRALQQGHLFSVSAHLSMQSKQNRCVHPLMLATSVRVLGLSKQIAQEKSSGTVVSTATSTAPPPRGLAAGFKSISSMSSSSSSSKTMGVSFVPHPRPARAALAGPLRGDVVVAVAEALAFPPLLLLFREAIRMEVRCGAKFSAIRVAASLAARRVERLGGVAAVATTSLLSGLWPLGAPPPAVLLARLRLLAPRAPLLLGIVALTVPTEKVGGDASMVPISRWRKERVTRCVLIPLYCFD